MELSLDWITECRKTYHFKAGVYVLFCGRTPVYVGETTDIAKRMNHLRQTYHHTVRRTIGKEYSHVPAYAPASSRKKFPEHIERKVNEQMNKLKVCAIPVRFGRREIEEYISQKYNPKYNIKK